MLQPLSLTLVIALAVVARAASPALRAADVAPAPPPAPLAADVTAAPPPPPPPPPPASQPASRPAGVDHALWQRMLAIDAKAAQVNDLAADFEQQKFTALLKKPLTSSGRVRVKGSTMLWDTRRPEPTQLRIDPREVRIYYPRQKTIEVYAIQQKLGQLAASPLPRLSALQQHFTFSPLPLAEMGEADDTRYVALAMAPTAEALREHVEQVRVLLDARAGLIIRLEMRDADGERTLITFSNPQPNAGLAEADLQIRSAADAKVTRPLAGLEGDPGQSPQPQQQ